MEESQDKQDLNNTAEEFNYNELDIIFNSEDHDEISQLPNNDEIHNDVNDVTDDDLDFLDSTPLQEENDINTLVAPIEQDIASQDFEQIDSDKTKEEEISSSEITQDNIVNLEALLGGEASNTEEQNSNDDSQAVQNIENTNVCESSLNEVLPEVDITLQDNENEDAVSLNLDNKIDEAPLELENNEKNDESSDTTLDQVSEPQSLETNITDNTEELPSDTVEEHNEQIINTKENITSEESDNLQQQELPLENADSDADTASSDVLEQDNSDFIEKTIDDTSLATDDIDIENTQDEQNEQTTEPALTDSDAESDLVADVPAEEISSPLEAVAFGQIEQTSADDLIVEAPEDVDSQTQDNSEQIETPEPKEDEEDELPPNVLTIRSIDDLRGFYLAKNDDKYALFGYVNDEIILLKEFSKLYTNDMGIRFEERTLESELYLVKVNNIKLLVEVKTDNMSISMEF